MSDNVRFIKAWTYEGVTNGEWMDIPGGKHTYVLTTRQWYEDTEQELDSLRAENKRLVAKYNRDMATAERLDDCHVKEIIAKDKRIEELETLHRELVEELNSDPEAHLMGWEGDDE